MRKESGTFDEAQHQAQITKSLILKLCVKMINLK